MCSILERGDDAPNFELDLRFDLLDLCGALRFDLLDLCGALRFDLLDLCGALRFDLRFDLDLGCDLRFELDLGLIVLDLEDLGAIYNLIILYIFTRVRVKICR